MNDVFDINNKNRLLIGSWGPFGYVTKAEDNVVYTIPRVLNDDHDFYNVDDILNLGIKKINIDAKFESKMRIIPWKEHDYRGLQVSVDDNSSFEMKYFNKLIGLNLNSTRMLQIYCGHEDAFDYYTGELEWEFINTKVHAPTVCFSDSLPLLDEKSKIESNTLVIFLGDPHREKFDKIMEIIGGDMNKSRGGKINIMLQKFLNKINVYQNNIKCEILDIIGEGEYQFKKYDSGRWYMSKQIYEKFDD